MKKIFPFKSILEDSIIQLRPLSDDDFNDLSEVAFDHSIWKYMQQVIETPAELKNWIQGGIYDFMNKQRVPLTIVHKELGKAIGSTSIGNISERDNRLEIGWTWLGADFQGTGINKRVKRLLLEYAFDYVQADRVEFKTDLLNQKSRRAITGIGAVQEGVLRSHTLMPDGRRRDTVYYSILKGEWPRVKQIL